MEWQYLHKPGDMLKSYKNTKTPEQDDTNIELLKYALMCRVLNKISQLMSVGQYKIPNRKDCKNKKAIGLLNAVYKVYTTIIN
jgi:hypothetical protein